jgi:hypothetical protein
MAKALLVFYGNKEQIPELKMLEESGRRIRELSAVVPVNVNFGDDVLLDWTDFKLEHTLPFEEKDGVRVFVRPSSKRIFNDWVEVDLVQPGENVIYYNHRVDLQRLMNILEVRHKGESFRQRRIENLDEIINQAERGERFSLIGS